MLPLEEGRSSMDMPFHLHNQAVPTPYALNTIGILHHAEEEARSVSLTVQLAGYVAAVAAPGHTNQSNALLLYTNIKLSTTSPLSQLHVALYAATCLLCHPINASQSTHECTTPQLNPSFQYSSGLPGGESLSNVR